MSNPLPAEEFSFPEGPAAGSNELLPEIGSLDFLALPADSEVAGPPPVGLAVNRFNLPPAGLFVAPRAVPAVAVEVRRIRFEGHTVFTENELLAIVPEIETGYMTQEDLDQLRHAVIQFYVSEGYINSGATIPDQDALDGVLTVRVMEGTLNHVLVAGNERLSERYLTSRIRRDRSSPLHFPTLQRRLQVLQSQANIARINAELKPGLAPGEALMLIEIEEIDPWSYGIDFHNQRSPSVGGEQIEPWVTNQNLSGTADALRARVGLLSGGVDQVEFGGLENYSVFYDRPIYRDDTSLVLGWQVGDYSILEEPFRSLAIEGSTWSAISGFRRPLHRSLEDEVWLSLLLERSHDETEVLGRPFSIAPGAVDGELDLSILQFGQLWTRRSQRSVLALQSTFSFGLNAFGATASTGNPDAEFFKWSVDGQYSRRLTERGDLVVFHGGAQLASGRLPPPAQLRVGGRYTVRGYRENDLVRDSGLFFGLDYQFPVVRSSGRHNWEFSLVPFVDGGVAWNHGGEEREGRLSVGLGLRAITTSGFRGELFYGIPLINRGDRSGNLQDHGIHFRMTLANY